MSKKSTSTSSKSSCKTFNSARDIISFNCFEFVKGKESGCNLGNVYKLKSDHKEDPELYLIKFHSKQPRPECMRSKFNNEGKVEIDNERYMREVTRDYIGSMLGKAAGNNVPDNYLVREDKGQIFICSKLIPNFQRLSRVIKEYNDAISVRKKEALYGIDVTKSGVKNLESADMLHLPELSIEGKFVEGIEEAVVFDYFIQHKDRHPGNFGLVDKGDHYDMVLLDYSEANIASKKQYKMLPVGDIDRYKAAQDKILAINVRQVIEEAYETIIFAFPNVSRAKLISDRESVIHTLEDRQREIKDQQFTMDAVHSFISDEKMTSDILHKKLGINKGELISHPILGDVNVGKLIAVRDQLSSIDVELEALGKITSTEAEHQKKEVPPTSDDRFLADKWVEGDMVQHHNDEV